MRTNNHHSRGAQNKQQITQLYRTSTLVCYTDTPNYAKTLHLKQIKDNYSAMGNGGTSWLTQV